MTLYLSGIDPIHLAIGTVLCPTSAPVRLVNQFQAQILTFDLQTPIIAGTAVSRRKQLGSFRRCMEGWNGGWEARLRLI